MTTDYLQLMQDALNQRNEEEATNVAVKAFEEQPENEHLLAVMCSVLFDSNINCYGLLLLFTERFPNSLYPIRVYIAQILCDNFQFDNATSEARYFLRLLYDFELFTQDKDPRMKEFMSKAFILLTSVYTGLGARSYTKRVLEVAQPFVSTIWQGHYQEEIENLAKDLEDSALVELDEQWEAFWSTGANFEAVYEVCKVHQCTEMVLRVELLHKEFQKDANYQLNENELFQVVLVNSEQEYLLG